ncbi:Uu.00g018880.m01.CDS01 [Anthostomella pinea]|uniref:Uu.00g018880.m01.CDS01 n=1 Tax=Anthostomella pinea TaxID=933095 RepID=A0AAI8VZU0_9PEZI|nr:Uu.00g018880.m01.CDS01 [Anthostomella pinea]
MSLRIDDQPPSQVEVGTTLTPPLVVSALDTDMISFLTVILLNMNDNPVDGYQWPGSLNKDSSREAGHEYATFSNIVINEAGYYKLRIQAIIMVPGAAAYDVQVYTNLIHVEESE